ncbi:MAG: hypothetical protein CXT73_06930 [Methanobacteriota archaeon]|jgi:hypothetical protein|nr:MAG: hypothetical protein CXT73_06930 [Euryarchaeota archaeon]
MKNPLFQRVIIDGKKAKAIMRWQEIKNVGEWSFTLNELKIRAGLAEALSENIDEYRKAIGVVMSVERSLKE